MIYKEFAESEYIRLCDYKTLVFHLKNLMYMAIKENSQILSEEKQMEVNVSYERDRKALIRPAQENKYMIESVGKSIYVLE